MLFVFLIFYCGDNIMATDDYGDEFEDEDEKDFDYDYDEESDDDWY